MATGCSHHHHLLRRSRLSSSSEYAEPDALLGQAAAASGTVVYEATATGFGGAAASGFDSDYDLGAPRGNAGPGGAISGPVNGAVYAATNASRTANPGPAQQQQPSGGGGGISRGGARKGSVYDGFGGMDV